MLLRTREGWRLSQREDSGKPSLEGNGGCGDPGKDQQEVGVGHRERAARGGPPEQEGRTHPLRRTPSLLHSLTPSSELGAARVSTRRTVAPRGSWVRHLQTQAATQILAASLASKPSLG